MNKRSHWPILIAAGVIATASPVWAQRVYIKSPALAETWKPAGAALTQVESLKVYDDELARIGADAKRQDLAVATNGVANRDDVVSMILASPRARLRKWPAYAADRVNPWEVTTAEGQLEGFLEANFTSLLGARPSAEQLNGLANLEEVLASRTRRLANYEDLAVGDRREFERKRPRVVSSDPRHQPEAKLLDTSCEALTKTSPGEQQQALNAAGDGRPALSRLIGACKAIVELHEKEVRELRIYAKVGETEGELQAAYGALTTSRQQIDPQGATERVARLNAEMMKAEASGKHSSEELAAFRKGVGEVLKTALDATKQAPSAVAEELALGELSEDIDAYLRADVCAAGDKATAELRTSAKCSEIAAGSVTDKTQATWGFLEALATLADANSPNTRSAPWLAGAKAIVAALEADAKLRTDMAKAIARQRQARFRALLVQASATARAQQSLEGQMPGCEDRLACAVTAYADGLDRGATPAEILAWREIYTERDNGVRRERAAVDKERQLLLAAGAQMDRYVNGGLEPQTLAELLQALGLGLIALP